LPTPESDHYVKNHYMSVNSNPTASQKKITKSSSKYFSFITGVIDTGD
jgi:hypothetical protein